MDIILYVLGVLVTLQLKSQTSMTLSTLEAKLIDLSEDVDEVIFMIQLLRSMKISVKLPVMARVDDVGRVHIYGQ